MPYEDSSPSRGNRLNNSRREFYGNNDFRTLKKKDVEGSYFDEFKNEDIISFSNTSEDKSRSDSNKILNNISNNHNNHTN